MIPFQTAYPMIFFMVFLILAGNTGFVSFLISDSIKGRSSNLVYCSLKPIL